MKAQSVIATICLWLSAYWLCGASSPGLTDKDLVHIWLMHMADVSRDIGRHQDRELRRAVCSEFGLAMPKCISVLRMAAEYQARYIKIVSGYQSMAVDMARRGLPLDPEATSIVEASIERELTSCTGKIEMLLGQEFVRLSGYLRTTFKKTIGQPTNSAVR